MKKHYFSAYAGLPGTVYALFAARLVNSMGSGDTDAVDANGSIYVNGGTIDITGNSAFDYDVSGELNGGTVTVNGSQITEMTNSMPGGMGGRGGRG